MNEHLYYCKVCKNRQQSSRYGVICGLTEKLPSFKGECEKYIFEEGVFEKLIEDKRNFYLKILGRKNEFEQEKLRIRISEKETGNRIQHTTQLPSKIEIFNSKIIYGVFSVVGIALAIFLGTKNEFTSENWFELLFLIIALTASISSIYLGFFSKKPALVLDNNGIKYKNKIIPWTNIVFTSFQTEWKKGEQRSSVEYLVIDKLDGKEKIKVGIWNINYVEFGHYLELFKEKYRRKK